MAWDAPSNRLNTHNYLLLALKPMNFKTCFHRVEKKNCTFISVAPSSKEAWEKLLTKAKKKVKNGGDYKEGK